MPPRRSDLAPVGCNEPVNRRGSSRLILSNVQVRIYVPRRVKKFSRRVNSLKSWGSLLLIRNLPDGTIYRLKSNALDGLSLGTENGDEAYGWASFAGRATYKEPDWPEPKGNYGFIAYVEDHNEPGRGTDRFWLEVRTKDRIVIPSMSMLPAAHENAVDIKGGNIVAPH